jgi:hypothetical protein
MLQSCSQTEPQQTEPQQTEPGGVETLFFRVKLGGMRQLPHGSIVCDPFLFHSAFEDSVSTIGD